MSIATRYNPDASSGAYQTPESLASQLLHVQNRRERKQLIQEALQKTEDEFSQIQSALYTARMNETDPKIQREIDALVSSMDRAYTKAEKKRNREMRRVQSNTEQELSVDRGTVSVEAQEKMLIEYFGNSVDRRLLKDFSRLNIGSFFAMLGKNRSEIQSVLHQGDKLTKAQFEAWGYRSNGALGGLELGTLKKATAVFIDHPSSDMLSATYMSGATINDLDRISRDLNEGRPASYPEGRLSQTQIHTLLPKVGISEQADVVERFQAMDDLNAIAVAHRAVNQPINSSDVLKNIDAEARAIDQAISEAYDAMLEDAEKNKVTLDAIKQVGDKSWWTGRIRHEAMGAFANIDRENGNTGMASMSFETFVKGLTVNVAGMTDSVKGGVRPGVVIHFNALNKTSADQRTGVSAGVGTSIAPVFVPFANAHVWRAERVDMNAPVDPTVQRLSAVGGSGFASLVYSREKSPMNLFQQVEYQFTEKCTELANKTLDEIQADPTLNAYYKDRITSVYERAGVTDSTPSTTKFLLLYGLVQSEVEKLQVDTANAEKRRASYRGAGVGVGHIMGVTFPLAGISFGRLKVEYHRPSEDEAIINRTEVISPAQGPVRPPVTMEVGQVNQLKRYQEGLHRMKLSILQGSEGKGSAFDHVLQAISDRDYDQAMKLLHTAPKGKEQLFKELRGFVSVAGDNIEERNKRLRAIMSYVYGSPLTTDAMSVNKRTYDQTRTANVRSAEARVLGISESDLTSESRFTVNTHTPKQLDTLIPGQHLSTMIISTSKRATHRADVYPASVEVSSAGIVDVSGNQRVKEGLLKNRTLQADIRVRYVDTLRQLGMSEDQFTEAQYQAYLLSGDTSVLPAGISPVPGKGVQWHEARAMISGSACMNLTYALAYPVFQGTPDAEVPLLVEEVSELPVGDMTVRDKRYVIGAAYRQRGRGIETEPGHDTNLETRPGHDAEVDPNAPPPTTGGGGSETIIGGEGGSFGNDVPNNPDAPVNPPHFPVGNPLSDGQAARLQNIITGTNARGTPGSRIPRRKNRNK